MELGSQFLRSIEWIIEKILEWVWSDQCLIVNSRIEMYLWALRICRVALNCMIEFRWKIGWVGAGVGGWECMDLGLVGGGGRNFFENK